jgi:Fic family protein
MLYNWQQKRWPAFTYRLSELQEATRGFDVHLERVKAVLSAFDVTTEEGKRLEAMVAEAVSTSAIEGEVLNPQDVMSSMKNRLGQKGKQILVRDYRASGVAALLFTVRETFAQPLTAGMLREWHQKLFEGYPVREAPEIVGAYRKDAIFVKAADLDKASIRFEAPPSQAVHSEMARFLKWFNESGEPGMVPSIRAAIAHLYFESIHPFCDGNGRLGRALVSKIVAQHSSAFIMVPFSVGLFEQRKEYYEALHQASFTLDVTDWILTFTGLLASSIQKYEDELRFQIRVLCLLSRAKPHLNERQVKVFDRMTREGAKGFAGGMSASKYQKIAHTSKATATRDLTEMVKLGVLVRSGEGSGVRYEIA